MTTLTLRKVTNLFYDGEMLLAHYQRWLSAYQEPIEAKFAPCMQKSDPKEAVRMAMEVMLTEIMPIALAEMIMFNNGRLEEAIQIAVSEGSCSSCATNLK